MNTQTHLLLGMALLSNTAHSAEHRATSIQSHAAILFGALLPDISLYVMWAQARLRGVSNEVIFGELYFQEFWQQIGAVTNSAPLFMLMLMCGWLAGGRLYPREAGARRLGHLLVLTAAAALLHVVCDLPLHHDDGHPHFWPLTDWVFSSPVSYWDPAHHGTWWSAFEMALGAGVVFALWLRFRGTWTRVFLLLALSSYGLMSWYWLSAFG